MCSIIQAYFNGIVQLLLPVSLLAKSSFGKYNTGKQYDQIFQQEIFSKITRLLLPEAALLIQEVKQLIQRFTNGFFQRFF